MRKLVYVAGLIFFSLHANAFEITFDKSIAYPGGIPQGWEKVGSGSIDILSPQPEEIGGEFGLRCSFFSAEGNNTLRTVSSIIPHDEIFCDNIAVECRVYLQPWQERVDYFQIVISTDGWKTSQEIGEPIALAVKGLDKSRWETVKRSKRIVGLRESGNAVSIGIKAIAAGSSERSGYVQYIKTQFVAVATPQDVQFEVNGEKVETVLPGESNACVSATLDVYPSSGEGAVTWTNVCCVLDRNGVSTNLVMKWDDKLLRWKSAVPLPAIDAGEVLTASVYTEYVSTLGKFGTPTNVVIDGKICDAAREQSGEITVRGTKKGSVWINEFAPDKVELCGTTNRVMLSGWKLELATSSKAVASYYADLSGLFCFSNNMINGVVGLEIRELEWRDVNGVPSAVAAFSPANSQTNYVVRLCNSAGVIEHDEVVALPLSGSVGKTKCTTWPQEGYGYDWEGTAESEIFDWTNFVASSFSEVNLGQGFKVPIEASLIVTTKTDTALLSYVTVVAKTRGLGNNLNPDATTSFPAQSFGGVATNKIKDVYSATPGCVPVELAASAFGWYSEPTNLVAQGSRKGLPVPETSAVLSLFPTIAMDDFSGTSLKAFWKNDSSCSLKWQVAQESGRDGVLQVATGWTDPGNAILNCSNFLQPSGRKCASISFDFKTYPYTSGLVDNFRVEVSTNSNWKGKIIRTKPLASKIEDRYISAWHSYRFVFEMTTEFAEADEIWVRLVSVSDGSTDFYTTIDNLRISFEDVALPTNLAQTVETPVSGGSTGFVLDVLPQTTDEIQEVSADLHITVNGVKKIVPFAFADGTLTNAIPLMKDEDGEAQSVQLSITSEALEKALGTRFYAGDTVKYYAEIRNNSGTVEVDENGVCKTVYETRYFPDNATIDDEGRWVVEGAYKAIEDQYGFTVDGPDIDILGTPVITADGIAFDYHAWDRTGNKGIIGLTATVRKEGEEVSTTSLFEGAATNRVTDTCALTRLDANTEYTLTISGKRNSGGDLTSKSITFVTRPVLTAATIVGTSTSTAKLTASGQAAGFVVTPSDWVQESDSVQGDVRTATWTRGEGTPNSQMSATVYATNKVGLASMTTNSPSGFTLAAVATKAPVIQKGTVTVEVGADKDYVAGSDDNPELTEYAVRVTTSDGGDALVKTNGVEVWKTLADWKAEPVTVEKPTIDLLSTNYFSFITRNFDKTVSPNESPVTTNCWFDMTAEVVGAEQTADFGKVDVSLQFSDPAQSEGAVAEVEYKIVGQGDWAPVDSFDVPFDEIEESTNLTWDAWTAVGEVEGNYEYLLRAKVTDAAHGRSSGWVELAESGTLDFVKPTVELSSETHRSPFNTAPLKVDVTFSEDVVGFTKNSVKVGNGTVTAVVTNNASSYTVEIAPAGQGERVLDISAWVEAGAVTDVYGNKNVATKEPKKWTYDTKPPVIQPIEGEPGEMVVTNGNDFAFTVSATDESTPLKYHWTTNKVAVADNETPELEGKDAREGTNVVTVCAEDAAGNSSTNVIRTWVVDTIAPTEPTIDGDDKPAAKTQRRTFSLKASSVDATKLTFWWSLNGAAGVRALPGEAFERDGLADGEYTVSVYATDEANNVSPTNSYSWIVDNVAPDNLKIEGTPAETPFVTTVTNVDLTASATDNVTPEDKIAYAWTFNGGKEIKGANLNQTPIEGTNTAKVVATDEAGNESRKSRTWVVDTHCPTNLVISGWPMGDGSPTNEPNFSLTATAMDATAITFWWSLDGAAGVRALPGAPFTNDAELPEGNHVVSVYATDEAVNVSETNYWAWTVDRTPPAVTNLTSTTPDPFGKGAGDLLVTVMFSEPVVGFDASKITVDNGATVASVVALDKDGTSYDVTIKPGDDGLITVKIEGEKVKDRAGNWNTESGTLTRTYDTQPPENFQFEATPKNTEVVATSNFNFAVSATDTTTVTYYWKTNEADYVALSAEKKDGVWVANFEGLASEGTNTLSVYGSDQLGNPTVTNSIWWVVDTIAPTMPEIEGTPEDRAYTKETGYSYTAKSEDATKVEFWWSLDGAAGVRALPFEGKGLIDGAHSVSVYAKDEAGNKSAATNWTWTVDTVHPKVVKTETVPASNRFNKKAAPLTVTVTFSEEVTDFGKNSLEIVNGKIDGDVTSGEEPNSYTFKVEPNSYNETTSVVEEVSIRIVKDKVHDRAGNESEAWELTKIYDTTTPIIELTSPNTPDPFNEDFRPMVVNIVISGKKVTTLSVDSICVTNGSIVAGSFKETTEDEGLERRTYELKVDPAALDKDGLITVGIPAGVVTNEAGTVNEPDKPLTRMYDNNAPEELEISGMPALGKTTSSRDFKFMAKATDSTTVTYAWWLNKQNKETSETPDCTTSNFVSKALVSQGTNWVSVQATDAAGNSSTIVRRMWIVDFMPPYDFTLTGTPGNTNEVPSVVTKETGFDYTADAKDDFSTIIYHWNTNSVELSDHPTNVVSTAREGTNTVTVWAEDIANNVCPVTNRIVWVVDTKPPTDPTIDGDDMPASPTRRRTFSLRAYSEDPTTAITYHWTLTCDGTDVSKGTEATFGGQDLVDGAYTASVYAEDEAHNVSSTNHVSWIVDNVAPGDLRIAGTPDEKPFVTTVTAVDLTAFATDNVTRAENIVYTWTYNEEKPFEGVGVNVKLERTAREGTNTASVCAKDEAGNVSTAVTRTWVVDTLAPSNLHFVATLPAAGAVTNGAAFAFTVQAEDATQLKYHWLTNGTEVADHYDPSFGGTAVEGTNTVSVYAEDEAHNVSLTNHISWTYDFKGPSTPKVDGAPMGGATNTTAFAFTASATDDWSRTIDFYWSLSDGQKKKGPTFSDDVKNEDGTYTMSVWAIDEAGNSSETNSWSWILDRVDPAMPEISGDPKSNSFVKVAKFDFTVALPEDKPDATAVEYHWTLDEDPAETVVTNFEGSVTAEGKHTAYVYAKDAAGNVSPTNSLSWTYDKTAPVMQGIDGTPANNSVTNVVKYRLQAQVDEVNPVTFHWTLDGATMNQTGEWLEGEVPEGYSNHVVTCYAEDAAGNVSAETNVWSWTVDTKIPTNLTISGMPANGATTNGTHYVLNATASDDTTLTFWWKLDEGPEKPLADGAAFEDDVAAGYGEHTVWCYAKDEAGNKSATNEWHWTVDTKIPTDLEFVVAQPGDKALTNDPYFVYRATAKDDTDIAFKWTLDDGAAGVRALPMDVAFTNDAPLAEGEHTVSVYAEDAAGNISAKTNSATWTVDLTPPTVELSTEIPEGKVINIADVTPNGFKVAVEFRDPKTGLSEPVVGFTAASVTITNGNGTVTAVETNSAASYTVWVKPDHDGPVPLKIETGAVKDLAGNGNVASEVLERECDITQPTVVSITSEMPQIFTPTHLRQTGFAVVVKFSEPVTNFTSKSIAIVNGSVDEKVTGSADTYTVTITPKEDGPITISIAGGVVMDLAGNPNLPSSDKLTRSYDSLKPTKPVITGWPANGSITNDVQFCLTAHSFDTNGIGRYVWIVNGETLQDEKGAVLESIARKGVNTVQVRARDNALHSSDLSDVWTWTVEDDTPGEKVDFGGGVYLEVNPTTHETNGVSFTAVDFHPGEASTVTMSGFGVDPLPQSDVAPNISGLRMKLIVCDTLEDTRWKVTVDSAAYYDLTAKELTVTIPEDGTKGGDPVEPYKSFFVFGVENIEEK